MTDVPTRCSKCKKHLPDGQGNQEVSKGNILRFCDKCWEKRCYQIPSKPPSRPKKSEDDSA